MEFTEIKTGQSKEMPKKMVLYGVPKIGKSRFAAQADDVFFINIEAGLDYVGKEVRSTPKLVTIEEVIGWLKHIYESETFTAGLIALDSIDWLEALARAKIEKQHGGVSITDQTHKAFSYGAGMAMVADEALIALRWIDAIIKKKNIPFLLIAHSQVRTVDLPTQDPYSRHELKLGKALCAKINEWADLILFADYAFHVNKEGKTSEPKPTLFAGGSAAFVGGGRMKLNKELPLDYNQLKKEICK
jgi:AAA domain